MTRSLRVLALFAGALLVVGAVVAVALVQPSQETLATSGVGPQRYVVALDAGAQECQRVVLPRGTADLVRVSVAGRDEGVGPIRLDVRGEGIVRDAPLLGGIAEFPIPSGLEAGRYRLCFKNLGENTLFMAGEGPDVLALEDLSAQEGTYALWVSFEDRDPGSWWSRTAGMISRVGAVVGAPLGGWSGWVAVLLFGAAIILALFGGAAAAYVAGSSRAGVVADSDTLSWRSLDQAVLGRRALIFVALIAGGTGSAWAIVTPTFQVPDEPAHYAYVQYLAETGKLPGASPDLRAHSDEQAVATDAIGSNSLIGRANNRVRESSPEFETVLEESTRLRSDNGGGQTGASPQPPLYYAIASLPYRASSWAPLPVQVLVLRLFSVLLLAATAVIVALVVSELFPSFPWAPFVAGTVVALQPMIGFISAGATPEAMMDALAAGLVLATVKGLRRPTVSTAIAIGLLGGAGAVTKITLVALLPAAVLAVGLVAKRLRDAGRHHEARRALTFGLVSAVALPLLYVVWTFVVGRGLFPPGASPPVLPADRIGPASVREFLSYAWQLYLPRGPWQTDQFRYFPLEETWIFGWLGRYGWLDYGIEGWLRDFGTYAIAMFALLAAAGAFRHRAALRARSSELLVMFVMTLCLAVVIAVGGYQYKRNTGLPFEQARYLFPLAALYGALAVLAVLGVGRRLRAGVVWLGLVLVITHALTGPFLTLVRYYA